MSNRTANHQDQKPLYSVPQMTNLSEEEVAAELGPVMLSGPQTLGDDAGYASDRGRERDLTGTNPNP